MKLNTSPMFADVSEQDFSTNSMNNNQVSFSGNVWKSIRLKRS